MKTAGIYLIQSILKPERVYIGSTMRHIGQRWNEHSKTLRKNIHRSQKLQNHFNKYGELDLVFEVIESGEYLCKQHLLSREQGWYEPFQYQNAFLPYFNNAKIAGSSLGIKMSVAVCKRNSEVRKGKHLSEEHKRNIGIGGLGNKSHSGLKASDETRKNLSISHIGLNTWSKGQTAWNKGIPSDRERCIKCGFFIGKKEHVCKEVSELTLIKMSESRMGEKNPFYGKHHTKESKQLAGDSIKKAWALKKLKKSA